MLKVRNLEKSRYSDTTSIGFDLYSTIYGKCCTMALLVYDADKEGLFRIDAGSFQDLENTADIYIHVLKIIVENLISSKKKYFEDNIASSLDFNFNSIQNLYSENIKDWKNKGVEFLQQKLEHVILTFIEGIDESKIDFTLKSFVSNHVPKCFDLFLTQTYKDWKYLNNEDYKDILQYIVNKKNINQPLDYSDTRVYYRYSYEKALGLPQDIWEKLHDEYREAEKWKSYLHDYYYEKYSEKQRIGYIFSSIEIVCEIYKNILAKDQYLKFVNKSYHEFCNTVQALSEKVEEVEKYMYAYRKSCEFEGCKPKEFSYPWVRSAIKKDLEHTLNILVAEESKQVASNEKEETKITESDLFLGKPKKRWFGSWSN